MKTRREWWFDLFSRRVSRRELLRVAGNASALVALGALPDFAPQRVRSLRVNPFSFGVASGDPLPDGVVLWTRIAADALSEASSRSRSVSVAWEVARDDAFRSIVQSGSALALPELGHSVHAEVNGLLPERPYWYRFHLGGNVSATGRTHTAPALSSDLQSLRFAFISCQHYEQGLYTAFRHLAQEELEFIIHLGDYIYEKDGTGVRVRKHEAGEVYTLEQYRARYALYRSDPDLQAAHAAFPWIVTSDDHEVDNDYANDRPEERDGETREQFLLRRAAAYQAFYEFMPLRRFSLPQGPAIRLYRRVEWGKLARFHVLDTRQYRTDQPCGGEEALRCPGAYDLSADMFGPEQERWLQDGLRTSPARWNVLANQVLIAQLARPADTGTTFDMDKWDGYVAARRRLLDFLAQAKPSNPLVLTGDIHSNWVADLKQDFDDTASAIVATEFAGTSMTSGGDGRDTSPRAQAQLRANPHLHFYNGQRGYVRCAVTPSAWTADYRVVPFVSRPGAPIGTRASFVVRSGVRGVSQP